VIPTVNVSAAPIDDLRACIADWDNLEGRSLVTVGPPRADATSPRISAS
jgi:hypothetical protein